MSKPVLAWAALSSKGQLFSYGNGSQFQFPIFPTRKEAKAWRNESPWDRGELKIVRVIVRGEDGGRKRG